MKEELLGCLGTDESVIFRDMFKKSPVLPLIKLLKISDLCRNQLPEEL